MASTTFVNFSTIIDQTWLNDVNANVYTILPTVNSVAIKANTTANYANTTANYANATANFAVANNTNIILSQNLTVPGTLFATNVTSLNIVTSNAVSTNTLIVNKSATWNGNILVNGTLTTTGVSNLSGNLYMTGVLVMNSVGFSVNTSALSISAAGGNASVPPSNTDYMIQVTGRDSYPSRVSIDSFGSGGTTSYPVLFGRSGRGTAASPSALQSGDILFRISGNGYGATGFPGAGAARFDFVTTENFTDTARGSRIVAYTTTPTTNTVVQVASFDTSNTTLNNNLVLTKYNSSNGVLYVGSGNTVLESTNVAIDSSNNRLQVTVNGGGNTSYAATWITYTPNYQTTAPSGAPGDKKGMMFFDVGGVLGNGIKLYWCSADYDGVSKIWWTQTDNKALWS
jgi:hypothetical protein